MAEPLTGVRIRSLVTPCRRHDPGAGAVWLPWIAAPLFMAVPIGGCALADRLRPPVTTASGIEPAEAPMPIESAAASVVPAGAVVTIGRR